MSKDPSTQVGAVVVRPDRTIAAMGWNGFPRGVDDDVAFYDDREAKLLRIVHAELNAILSAREMLTGYSLYVSPFFPCANCAASIIQSGIKEVITDMSMAKLPDRWRKQFAAAETMFAEADVLMRYFHRSY